LTKPREQEELRGLVYSLTEKPSEEHLAWYKRPVTLAAVVLFLTLLLNIIFW
jgi:SSS family solute:Na+ symporter